MPGTEHRRSAYVDALLDAAEREFAREGFAGAKMTAIARRADLSLATVYKTFRGKEDLWHELHSARMDVLLGEVAGRIDALDSPLERLLEGIGAVAEFLVRHEAYLELSLRAGSGWLSTHGGTGHQRTVWESGLETITTGVRQAQLAGEVHELSPHIAAGMVVSALQVWLADWVDGDRKRNPDLVVAELLRHLRAFLGGVDRPRNARSGPSAT